MASSRLTGGMICCARALLPFCSVSCLGDGGGSKDMSLLKFIQPNKSLQATRDGAFSSASRFTSFDPACLSSGR